MNKTQGLSQRPEGTESKIGKGQIEGVHIDAPNDHSQGVTLRVIVLCVLLAGFFGYIIPVIDVRLSNTFLGAAHLPPGAIAVLLILLLAVNPLLKLLSQRMAFRRNEILTVYITCLFSCLVPGHGAENFFVSNLVGPFYYATSENKWLAFLQPYLKPWFTPAIDANGNYNRSITEAWYTGMISGENIPWGAWLVPLAAWSVFIVLTYIMLGCLGVMLRAQWSDREVLAFPLLRLPVELTEDVDRTDTSGIIGRFFRNGSMWIGFGLGVLIQTINGLNTYFPDVPGIPLELPTAALFSDAPWNQMGAVPIQVWPVVVGITYLLTSEISFSLWFFFLFIKFQLIVAYALGFMPAALPNMIGHTGGAKNFTGFQQIGAYCVYVALVLWVGRDHFRHIMARAFGRVCAGEGERHEPISYPVAFWGFILSLVLIVSWSTAAGMRLDVALILWLTYLIIAIALTRVVAEGGMLFVQQGWTPLGALAGLLGSGPGSWLSPSSIVPASFVQASIMTDMRGFLLPSFVQSFKLASDRHISPRPLLALISVVTLISLAMSLWMNVRLGYNHGGLTLNNWFAVGGAQQPAWNAATLIGGSVNAGWANWAWLSIGMVLTYCMILARSRFLWFPLHPLGYLMCLTYPMNMLWFSIFLGWLIKSLVVRFGGTNNYQRLIPTFLGLVLGDITMMLVWLIVDGLTGRTGHQLMPG